MGRIRQVPRRLTDDISPPKKRPRTSTNGAIVPNLLDRNGDDGGDVSREEYEQALEERDAALNELRNLKAELKEVQSQGTSDRVKFAFSKTAMEAENKVLKEILDKEVNKFASELKGVLEKLCNREAELEKTCLERDSYRNNLELGKKEWQAEKKALTERLNKTSQERNIYRNSLGLGNNVCMAELEKSFQKSNMGGLELGNNVWEAKWLENAMRTVMELQKKEFEADKKTLTQRLNMISQERDSYQSNLELRKKDWEAERKDLTQRLDMISQERNNYQKSLELSKKEWEEGKKALTQKLKMTAQELDSYGKSLELGNKVREPELDKSSEKGDMDSLELGNNLLEAERIKMAKRIPMAKIAEAEKIEMAEITAMANKGKTKPNCSSWGLQEDSWGKANWSCWGAPENSWGKANWSGWGGSRRLTQKLKMTAQELDSYGKSLELGNKVWGAELDKSSEEGDMDSLELGDNVWEAERIKMAKRIPMTKIAEAEKIEMSERTAMGHKEKTKGNWPRWGTQEDSYAPYDFQIG